MALHPHAQGIEHLHHLRVVHGDLKPGNVLLKGSRVDVRGFNAQVRAAAQRCRALTRRSGQPRGGVGL